ncbi:hypothetical protein PIROE2DRAFT_16274 [Piromyces sp. E2]|nr:hypothetical protein PIROE2DRAFT_16274 [Piromyces sp. E2]|eukprot:OUM58444.1 hypothetical protein PIROE2DRAFT_16274 [Piromyces sp. E2]
MPTQPLFYSLEAGGDENHSLKLKFLTSNEFYEKQKITYETRQLFDHFNRFIKVLNKKPPYDPSSGISLSEFNRHNRNELFMSLNGPLEKVYSTVFQFIKNEHDNYDIPTIIYRAKEKPTNDLIIFVHGGGWTQGNFKTHEYICRKLTNILEKDVLAIEYRLAPENTFPKPLDDVLSVYKAYAEYSNYQNIIFCGDSGGGQLCSAACIKIYEEGIKRPEASILFYPPLGNDFNSRSFQKFGECVALTKKGTIAYTSHFCGKDCQSPEILSNKYIFPVLQKDMNAFPREIIATSGYDVLYDGQVKHVKNMLRSGRKDLTWLVYPGIAHGFMTYGKYYNNLITQICHTIKKVL